MFILREVFPDDLDDLHAVATHLDSVNLPDDSQTPPQNSPADCKKEICSGGSVTSVNDDSESPIGPPPVCTQMACAGGAPA